MKDKSKFKEYLKEHNIPFEENDKGIIINGGDVDLSSLELMPENIQFKNGGDVWLNSLESLTENIQLNNGSHVYLDSLKSLPENTQFNNGGFVNLCSLKSLPENTQFNNGGDVDLSSLETLPENTQFNNGGHVDSKSEGKEINTPYIKRFKVETKGNKFYLYKKVSKDFKTQENTKNETVWKIGSTLDHPNWNPEKDECGEGKFHACAFPHWCDRFRNITGDRYIKIEINKEDLFEWKTPNYPQKIGFRKGTVIKEVEKMI